MIHYQDDWLTVHQGDWVDVLREMPAESVHCVVTSPPYWGLRDYGTPGQLGLEATPEAYVSRLVEGFREVRRVLRNDGTLWLNLGDSYAQSANTGGTSSIQGTAKRVGAMNGHTKAIPSGLKPKDLVGIPWRVAFALQADGWYLRSDIIWAKPNPMPESVTDRPTKSHEYLFLLAKASRYFYDAAAANARPSLHMTGTERNDGDRWREVDGGVAARGTRNLRSVWTVATQPYSGAHFATFPRRLVEPCIKAGCPTGGVVLDPFAGSGTTGLVAQSLSRRAILIDLSTEYLDQVMRRNQQTPLGIA